MRMALIAGATALALSLGACGNPAVTGTTGAASPAGTKLTFAQVAAKIEQGFELLPSELPVACAIVGDVAAIAAAGNSNSGTILGKSITGAKTLVGSSACTSTAADPVSASVQLAAAAKAIAAATNGSVTPSVAAAVAAQ